MCNFKETEISQKRSKGIKNWKITYSVILSVLSNKTNLILGLSSPLKKLYLLICLFINLTIVRSEKSVPKLRRSYEEIMKYHWHTHHFVFLQLGGGGGEYVANPNAPLLKEHQLTSKTCKRILIQTFFIWT